jgi:dipeptidyl aminopeptidase/acylaminoacyl peptidase
MINAGKQFDLQLYSGETHGITGAADRTHLYHRILHQFEQYLLATQPAPAQP